MTAGTDDRMIAAFADLSGGFRRSWLWGGAAWSDLRQRYRGSLLGPFWLTAGLAVLVAGLGLILAGPLGMTPVRYVPFVAIGLVLWQFIQAVVNESTMMFVTGADIIRQSRIPLSVHAYRLICRNVLVLAHTALVIPVVLLIYQTPFALTGLLAVPGFLLFIFAAFWTSLALGVLGARFRDTPPIMTNLLQLVFFMTPVFWPVSTLGPGRAWIAACNPVFAFLDIIRAPLLGAAPAATSWPVAGAATLVMTLCGLVAFGLNRRRLAFWI